MTKIIWEDDDRDRQAVGKVMRISEIEIASISY